MLSALGRLVGPALRSAGTALESAGKALGGTCQFPEGFGRIVSSHDNNARILADDAENQSNRSLQVAEQPYFLAPSAHVKNFASLTIADGASIWYNAVVEDNATIGAASSVQDSAFVGPKSLIGSFVTVQSGASLGPGVILGDRCFIGAGAKLEEGVKVESDSIVAPGAVLPKGTTVKSRELWYGSPAAKVADLEDLHVEEIVETAEHISEIAMAHRHECSKSLAQLVEERDAYLNRDMWTKGVLEERGDTWDTFVSINPNPDMNKHRRGLIFNK